jgi:hypothetical protein
MRVSVTPQNVTIAYVRSYLPGDGTNGEVADSVVIGQSIPDILGDVSGDGAVTAFDAALILKGDVGLDVSEFCPMNCGDVTGDGFVDIVDALWVLKHTVHIETLYSIGQEGCPTVITPPAGCSP